MLKAIKTVLDILKMEGKDLDSEMRNRISVSVSGMKIMTT